MDQGLDLELAQLEFRFQAGHVGRLRNPLLNLLRELRRQVESGKLGGEIHAEIIPA